MNQSANNLRIEVVNPHVLTNSEFTEINEVTQDMWAYGIGELAHCKPCSKMLSKQDVFGHLPKEIYEKTVAKIIKILGTEDLLCPSCGRETMPVYGEKNIASIRERLLESDSFLLVCKNPEGEIVGYMDGYVDTLETIFRRELHCHYSLIGYATVRERVDAVLGYSPPMMMSFSSMGLAEKYTNFFMIFQMLNAFSGIIPDQHLIPGITELDKNNNLYDLYGVMGRISLKI